jgi:predicted acylesterase/phospholipase RssA
MTVVKHLVFAGGGPRCLSLLGALEVLNSHKMLDNVKQFWGNSAGALMATMLSLNVPLPRIRQAFYDLDFTKFRDIDLGNIVSFGTNWGLDSGEAFTKNLKMILEELKPGSSEYTLQELPNLHITASDLTITKPVILDSKSFPTLKLVDALRASTSIPFFYMPFRNPVNNHLLVDGAVACNFPWVLLPDSVKNEGIGFDYKITDISKEPKNLSEYIPKILNFRDKCWRSNVSKEHENVILFNIRGFPAWHLALKKEDRDELIKIGSDTATEWVTLRSHLETTRKPPLSSGPNTPLQVCPLSLRGGLSGSPLSLCQQQPLGSRRGSPSRSSLISRRWSL